VVAFGVGLWAVMRRRVNVASFALFAGITGAIAYVLLAGGPLRGYIDLLSIPAFALLALPIVIAGVFGGPLPVAVTTVGTVIFSLVIIALTPHSADLSRALQHPDGYIVFTVTISVQVALGILMFAATRGFQRTQRELGDVRVAYAREKELERLKDRFLSSVNHELRTPIMALQGYLELARELGARGDLDRQRQMLARGTEAADHLAKLVTSVLDVRRVEVDTEAMRPIMCELEPIILSAVRLLDPREGGEQERPLRLRVPADLCVYADADRVRQVMLNLTSNALKYSGPGAPIEITARVEQPVVVPHGWRRATIAAPQLVEVSVRDYGLGIPPDQATLLFQRFVRLERDIASAVVGTGLGLALCRSHVEAMGGHIWVESTGVPGEGSTFTFTLPLGLPASNQNGHSTGGPRLVGSRESTA
jgi:signal transduction histidine kinase